ncbi:MAG: T9SS type A sorting domain-containing protein [Bacteroidales bacterium]|nr:T9SS type A sorting domain-containing protein [Bacteroidales bacterium]
MGTYTLTFDVKGDYENLYLLDKMTGEKVNILLENEYSFIANSNDNNDRFIIKMDNSQQTTDNSHFAYVSGENLIITDISGEAQINIYDALGRCVLRMDAASHVRTSVAGRDAACHVLVDGFDSGIYIIQKIDENGVNVQKVVIY